MRAALAIIALFSCSCHGQNIISGTTTNVLKAPKRITEGMLCDGAYLPVRIFATVGGKPTVLYGADEWYAPEPEKWSCVDKKWKRDIVMDRTMRDMTVQKLDAEEMQDIGVAAQNYPDHWFATLDGHPSCRDACSLLSLQSANLVAQLSFWNPTEQELPLKMLMSYVKGMSCNEGTMRAYSIMNARIIEWLMIRVKTHEYRMGSSPWQKQLGMPQGPKAK